MAEGWEIKWAPIDQFYVHIDLMVCMLNERCAAVCLETTEDDVVEWLKSKKIEIIPASFKETMALGCNVVALGKDRVLSTASAKDLNKKMKAAGFQVYDPEMTMFTWAGGGVHCMCQPLRRE
jgi:N-dimethylarginine dimethylaminohydrolase